MVFSLLLDYGKLPGGLFALFGIIVAVIVLGLFGWYLFDD